MVTSILLSGIEQVGSFACKWINAFRLRPFVLIAQFTGQTQILLYVSAPSGKWPDVINLMPTHDVVLVAQAVLTAVPCTLTHTPSHAD
jgi:hypothetical protein